MRIVGGNLALDFVNTRAGPRHGRPDTEWLSSYDDFLALADGSAPPEAALRRMQLAYLEALAHAQLVGDADGCAWSWDSGSGLLAPLWPIVAAAVGLLTSQPADHIKPCHACRFMFIDHSKNGSRRWCSMEDCGKAAKIARYLQRRSGQ